MGLLRSETMKHGTLVLPHDRAREFMDLLGRKTNVQITDMNATTMRREYKKHIQRIEECERILRFLQEEIDGLPQAELAKGNVEDFLAFDSNYSLDAVEKSLTEMYTSFVQFRDNNLELLKQRNVVVEEHCVVTAAMTSLSGDMEPPSSADMDPMSGQSLLSDGAHSEDAEAGLNIAMKFSNVAGVIPQSTLQQFSRTLFRVTRGNAFTHSEIIEKPLLDEKTGKEVIKFDFLFCFFFFL
eukprot:Selendium_serpulae@DN6670_c0_g1_i1.p1